MAAVQAAAAQAAAPQQLSALDIKMREVNKEKYELIEKRKQEQETAPNAPRLIKTTASSRLPETTKAPLLGARSEEES